jgi:cell wall-associated NlpC family hydrolase
MRPVRQRLLVLAWVAAALGGGCATQGGTPRPFPTPGGGRAPDAAPATVGVAPDSVPALLDTALRLVGTRYRAGGETPDSGFDCSGFVAWVFGQHGLLLPRTVTGQYGTGAPVSPDREAAAADLVFFATGTPGAGHVGIALGDGRFVHAPSSRGVVRVESLGTPYWSRRYLGARRMVGRAAVP